MVFWVSVFKAFIDGVLSFGSLTHGQPKLALLFAGYVVADIAAGMLSQ